MLYTAAIGWPDVDDMRLFDGVRNRETFLRRELDVEVGKKDGLIIVTLSARDPDEATKMVDHVVESYKAFKSKQRRDTASGVLAILEKDNDKTEAALSAKEDAIVNFQQTNNTLSFDGDKSNYIIQRANSLADALTQAHIDTINLKTAYQAAAQTIDADTLKQVEAQGGGVMLSAQDEELLRAHLFSLREELAEKKRTYLPDHPLVKSLEGQIKDINVSVVASARLRWTAAEEREQELQKSFDEQQKLAMDMSGKAAEFERLKNDATQLQSHAAQVDKQIKDLQETLDAGAMNITVIDPANTENQPVKPVKLTVLGIALIAGLMLGAVAAVGREWLDPRLRDASDVKTTMGVPVLGTIPHFPGAQSPEALGWAVHLDPSSEAAEAYRTCPHSACSSAPKSATAAKRRSGSPSPAGRDGKSTLASNLAIAMAKVGKNVLLIDADFRSPTLHRIFGVSGEVGFSSVLSAGEMVDRAVRRTTVERLHVMPAGPSVRNPSELLNSAMLGEILDGLSRTYDHIVIDTPPVARVDDARIVAASADCTILVLRADKSNRKLAEDARDRLMSVGARITGVVLNDVSGAGGGLGGLPVLLRGDGRDGGRDGSRDGGRENESQTPVDDAVSHASVRPVTGSGQVA